MSDLIEIKKMLTALLKNQSQLHWIGGYVQGRTSNDDPFILLYPSDERLKEKVCRVYPHDFKKLPAFVDKNIPEGITQDGNPNKEKAAKQKIFHTCPPFLITTYRIPNANMEYEVRFCDVLRVPNQKPETPPSPAALGGRGAGGEGEMIWCDWCGDHPAAPGEPCDACRKLGASQANKPKRTQPAVSPLIPPKSTLPTEREHYFTYATITAKLSQGAAQIHLDSYGGNFKDALQALQAEQGDRPTPPAREEVDATKYYAFCRQTLGWSRDGAKQLLDQYHGDFSAAYAHAKTHQNNGVKA